MIREESKVLGLGNEKVDSDVEFWANLSEGEKGEEGAGSDPQDEVEFGSPSVPESHVPAAPSEEEVCQRDDIFVKDVFHVLPGPKRGTASV